jgi:hypothetical protein
LIESFAFVGIDKTMTICNSISYDLNKS